MKAMQRLGFLLILSLGTGAAHASGTEGSLANEAVAWHWRMAGGKLQATRFDDKRNGTSLPLTGELFRLTLGNGTRLKASEFRLEGAPKEEAISADPQSPTAARHFPGRQLTARFSAPEQHLAVDWRAILREGSTYVRQEVAVEATGGDVLVKEIETFGQVVAGARTAGTAEGSPVVANTFFIGYEHPMARNVVWPDQRVTCSLTRNAVLRDGETLSQSCVIGAVPAGQLRRGFLAYVERERAHPYRPFLYYDSWFDISFATRQFNEADAVGRIGELGRELTEKRGVQLDSFLMDDGWDDSRNPWRFHSGFPRGFAPLKDAARAFNAGVGVWISPFGGFDERRPERLKYGSLQWLETNASGFSLAGPNYYGRFREVCMDMIQKQGVVQFKFDGIAASGVDSAGKSLMREGDAMLRLISDFRSVRPDIYINQTSGTWPSPFWLLYVDSTWRGDMDHSFQGKGTERQRWLNYRDMSTYRNVVQGGPLYPLNSIMLHGIIFATHGEKLERTDDKDFADEVRSYFGTGTQLQELYLTPKLLNERNWNDLAEAAKWSRANADVLVDTHWVGGDPGKGEVYGWASWSPRKAILVLRNPDDQPAKFAVDARQLWELPDGHLETLSLRSPWSGEGERAPLQVVTGKPRTFELQPFEVLVLETSADAVAERRANEEARISEPNSLK